MFICNDCLEKSYENKITFMTFLSRGNCESCGHYAVCGDIHHSRLILKKEKKPDTYGNTGETTKIVKPKKQIKK